MQLRQRDSAIAEVVNTPGMKGVVENIKVAPTSLFDDEHPIPHTRLGQTADIVQILKDREVDVLVSYLPVGSEEATKWYVEQALTAGVGFVNAIPVFIGREQLGVPAVFEEELTPAAVASG